VLLADEFFLIAWDTAGSGTPLLHVQATSLGLAGALLSELVLYEQVTVHGAKVEITGTSPIQDPLAYSVLKLMASTPEHADVRTWLAYLAQNTVEAVATRLQQSGLVVREESRSLLMRKGVRYVATDYAKGAWPSARLEMLLVNGRPMAPSDMALVAMTEATGLLDSLLTDSQGRRNARRYLGTVMATLPGSIRDLAGHVHAAVGDAVLSYRS
jgi:Golgi phosphoprotein 3 (GPP34)